MKEAHFGADRQSLVIDVRWSFPSDGVDMFVVIEDEHGHILRQRDVLYVSHPRSQDGFTALRHEKIEPNTTLGQVQLELPGQPDAVGTMEIVVAARQPNLVLTNLTDLAVELWDPVTGASDLMCELPEAGLAKCVLVGRLLRRHSGWTFGVTSEPLDADIINFVSKRAL